MFVRTKKLADNRFCRGTYDGCPNPPQTAALRELMPLLSSKKRTSCTILTSLPTTANWKGASFAPSVVLYTPAGLAGTHKAERDFIAVFSSCRVVATAGYSRTTSEWGNQQVRNPGGVFVFPFGRPLQY